MMIRTIQHILAVIIGFSTYICLHRIIHEDEFIMDDLVTTSISISIAFGIYYILDTN
jgi:hypothetical protein